PYCLFSYFTYDFLPIIGSTASDSVSTPPSFKLSTRESLPFIKCYSYLRHLHSFPTRRSSDLHDTFVAVPYQVYQLSHSTLLEIADRKSTRLNSSHGSISYAVFCLKKKNKGVWKRRYC